jgi:hypothetical protein
MPPRVATHRRRRLRVRVDTERGLDVARAELEDDEQRAYGRLDLANDRREWRKKERGAEIADLLAGASGLSET